MLCQLDTSLMLIPNTVRLAVMTCQQLHLLSQPTYHVLQ